MALKHEGCQSFKKTKKFYRKARLKPPQEPQVLLYKKAPIRWPHRFTLRNKDNFISKFFSSTI